MELNYCVHNKINYDVYTRVRYKVPMQTVYINFETITNIDNIKIGVHIPKLSVCH